MTLNPDAIAHNKSQPNPNLQSAQSLATSNVVSEPHRHVPLMFRAQVEGRCQLQRLERDEEPDAVQWANEWVDKIYPAFQPFVVHPGEHLQTRTYSIAWRLVTNSGVDDSVIRPVMGARGWVFFPGSSMKGMFRRACTAEQADRYCGSAEGSPGILRFEGGYPIDTEWTAGLVDIVHPQQSWQTGEPDVRKVGALAQISLYKPTLKFAISSRTPDPDWDQVWQIWERAIAQGIGSRVCAGYGQVVTTTALLREQLLYRTCLKGQGQAPKLLTGTGEFRPNIFRSALRGHALRLLSGLTDGNTAKRLVEQLFGGVQGQGVVGLVRMRFQESQLEMTRFQADTSYEQLAYRVEGELALYLTRQMPDTEAIAVLKKFLEKLVQFAMIFGGFGKSWRRADHRLFFEEYYENDRHKPLIGCHWQWLGKPALVRDVQVRSLEDVGALIEKVRAAAGAWMRSQGVVPDERRSADWRETWQPQRVQVWGRLAADVEESEAIRWLHQAYQERIAGVQAAGTIRRSTITGQVGQVGRLWHRMYPRVRLVKDPQEPQKPLPKETREYLELLTIFPDDSPECQPFLDFLAEAPFGFRLLWGDSI